MSAVALDRLPPRDAADTTSRISVLARLEPAARKVALDAMIAEAGGEDKFIHAWPLWARPQQFAPAGRWFVWLISAGRGFGKTRSGAEWVRERVRNGARRVGIVGRTPRDVRQVMIEGPSGLLAVSEDDERPKYEPSKRLLTWPNGCVGTTYSSEQPEDLRGPEHDTVWCDEIATWRFEAAWDNMEIGCRYGDDPRICATTTPRPIPVVRKLYGRNGRPVLDAAGRPTGAASVVLTRGTTYENMANLAETYIDTVIRPREGTRVGRQDLLAELLEDVPGALWTRALLDRTRIQDRAEVPDLVRIAVGVDPEATSGEESAETGVVVVGAAKPVGGRGVLPETYVLGDATIRGRPLEWARAAVDAYHANDADMIVAEINNGGEMVETVIHTVDPKVPVFVVHASRGKRTRAEPVAALYEQGKAHHVGSFAELEDEMCEWVPGTNKPSPDRMDACVWAHSWLLDPQGAAPRTGEWGGSGTGTKLTRSHWATNIGNRGDSAEGEETDYRQS